MKFFLVLLIVSGLGLGFAKAQSFTLRGVVIVDYEMPGIDVVIIPESAPLEAVCTDKNGEFAIENVRIGERIEIWDIVEKPHSFYVKDSSFVRVVIADGFCRREPVFVHFDFIENPDKKAVARYSKKEERKRRAIQRKKCSCRHCGDSFKIEYINDKGK